MNNITNIENKKTQLQQKKNRLIVEETKLKIKERKMRTKHLIELGGLVTKAKLDHLPKNTLYGALLSITTQIKSEHSDKDNKTSSTEQINNLIAKWSADGNKAFNNETNIFTPIILNFPTEPPKDIRTNLRQLGLRFNRFRTEWYGQCKDINALKLLIKNTNHNIEVLE